MKHCIGGCTKYFYIHSVTLLNSTIILRNLTLIPHYKNNLYTVIYSKYLPPIVNISCYMIYMPSYTIGRVNKYQQWNLSIVYFKPICGLFTC